MGVAASLSGPIPCVSVPFGCASRADLGLARMSYGAGVVPRVRRRQRSERSSSRARPCSRSSAIRLPPALARAVEGLLPASQEPIDVEVLARPHGGDADADGHRYLDLADRRGSARSSRWRSASANVAAPVSSVWGRTAMKPSLAGLVRGHRPGGCEAGSGAPPRGGRHHRRRGRRALLISVNRRCRGGPSRAEWR